LTTLKDIAKKTNVSPATVSRIINNDPSLTVLEETRNRVMEAVRELNYQPARKRNRKREIRKETYNIGLILTASKEDETNDPYFMSIRKGIESVDHDGLHLAAVLTVGISDFSQDGLDDLDGLIVIGALDSKELNDIFPHHKNIVFVDYIPDDKDADIVISDIESATRQCMEHLFELGHKEIAYLGGRLIVKGIFKEPSAKTEDIRKSIYQKMMEEKGLFKEENVFIGEWSPTGGYQLMKKMIGTGNIPSAALIASDPMALGAFRALHEAGINVPEELSVFSFDDITSAAYFNPALSTVKIHAYEMGRTAVKLLHDRLEGREVPIKAVLPTELIFRESTGVKKG
jgi:LacI family transcriptional regulator